MNEDPSHLENLRKPLTADCRRCVILKGLKEAGLSGKVIGGLCGKLSLCVARRRQLLFLEGNRASHFYAVRKGRVKLVKLDAAGREHIVEVLTSGSLFGLESIFADSYSTSAEVLEDTELCVGSRRELNALVETASGFGLGLARHVHQQLERSLARQACLGTVGAKARLAAYLLQEARQDGDEHPAVPNHLTLAELGAILGMAGETVCRTLGALRSSGLIEMGNRTITVLDRRGLRRTARL